MSKVYHVEMKEPIDGKKHFYFGSQIAIFEVLTVKQVGISYKALSNNYRLLHEPYENKKCIIRLGTLVRKKTERGKPPEQFFHI